MLIYILYFVLFLNNLILFTNKKVKQPLAALLFKINILIKSLHFYYYSSTGSPMSNICIPYLLASFSNSSVCSLVSSFTSSKGVAYNKCS